MELTVLVIAVLSVGGVLVGAAYTAAVAVLRRFRTEGAGRAWSTSSHPPAAGPLQGSARRPEYSGTSVHYENFLLGNVVCGAEPVGKLRASLTYERVTCPECLRWLGRPPNVDGRV